MGVDYSGLADAYDRARGGTEDVYGFWLPSVALLAELRPRERVLDVGCGTGRLSVPLSGEYRVVGLDASREMLRVAASKGGSARFVRGDARRMPFPNDAFQVALGVLVLHLVPDFREVVREAGRVARRVLFATIDMDTRAPHAIDEAFPSLHGIDAARFPAIDDLLAACREAGFRKRDARTIPRKVELSTAEFLERVRARYLSTLAVLPPGEFERGLAWLEAELPRRGDRYAYDHAVTFVTASR